MGKVGIWVSGLLASAIPFIFVGAVVALLACVFDAVGEHRPTARSRASFQAEAAPTEQVVAVADARHHHAGRSGSHPSMRHTWWSTGKLLP